MAQSIKLGNDVFLAASGVDGNKGTIGNGDDLNNYYGPRYAGLWVVNDASTNVANAPLSYCGLIVIAMGIGGAHQIAFNSSALYYRSRSGATPSWGAWRRASSQNVGRVTGTASNISLGSSGYASIGDIHTLGVPQGATVIGVGIRGWNGASDMPISVLLSSDGNTLYATGQKNSTINSFGYFISYVE